VGGGGGEVSLEQRSRGGGGGEGFCEGRQGDDDERVWLGRGG
jgi:hypothetical protein